MGQNNGIRGRHELIPSSLRIEAVVSQFIGAVLRAVVVLIVIATPALLIPGADPESAQVVTLVGLITAIFVAVEYNASYPALIEFRDAPPFNRVRIIAAFLTLFGLSVIMTAAGSQSTLALVLTALGLLVGRALEFPYSPLTLVLETLPEGTDIMLVTKIQIMAGLACFISLLSLCIFAILIRLQHWPNRGSAFNVWINLPTFDPTTGGDVVTRLIRDSRVNVILGLTLPFILPAMLVLTANHFEVSITTSPQTLVWSITLWMFLPLSLFMRGLAMGRIADMIRARRARLVAGLDHDRQASLA